MKRQQLGAWGENLALRHLQGLGYLILTQNWRSSEGEIDLVALDGETLVFIEVKTRSSKSFGWPEESITAAKRLRLQRVAWSYLDAHDLKDADWRVDVFAIETTSSGGVEQLEHFINAVEGDGAV